MLAIAFTFPAGRYHATPWGRHVNEADIAWPPDLWRIARALIAVWHRKTDPRRFSRQGLHELVARLAEAEPPSYALPESVIHAHTRHYMPGKGASRPLVFDAFARIAHDAPLVIAWPGLHLDSAQAELLDALLENLGFLGRAESWVDARRVPGAPDVNCVPAVQSVNFETGEVTGDIVRLMTPTPPDVYRSFRSTQLAAAGIDIDPANRARKLKQDQQRLLKTLPEDWLSAIGAETNDLQAAGWNAPPCARTISYRRPLYALRSTASTVVRRLPTVAPRESITTARLVVYGKPLPRIEDAIRCGEALRAAAMGHAKVLLGPDALPSTISGHKESGHQSYHSHAFWLPDPNAHGEINHVLVHAPNGLSPDVIRVLTTLRRINRGAESLRLILEGTGPSALFDRATTLTGESAVWQSITPYLHPWHLKKPQMRTPEATMAAILSQLRREWRARGPALPDIIDIREMQSIRYGGRYLRSLHFQRSRRKHGLVQPDPLGRLLEIRFAQPVRGPIALGFACHFGLGLFAPVQGATFNDIRAQIEVGARQADARQLLDGPTVFRQLRSRIRQP